MAEGVSREVSWPLDDTTMYATVVMPQGASPFPGVVMVAGSGPTDRDWNTPLLPGDNGSARLLADALAARGFASLRYDKRAAGPHAAENFPKLIGKVSFATHLDELAGAVAWLAGQDRVDGSRIFALTNSEGGLHALNYQVHGPAIPFAGMVLTAPPGRVMSAVGRAQVVAQLSTLPNAAALVDAYDEAIGRFQAGKEFEPDPNLPEAVQMLLRGLSAAPNLPFARELWLADAATWLALAPGPVLVVIGKKDLQVHWQADGERLQEAAAARKDIEFVFPEDANHVLKHEPRGLQELGPAEAVTGYNAPGTHLDPTALTAILDWLAGHAMGG